MLWPTIRLWEIDDAKRPKGTLKGLIKIKKEEGKYGGGGLLHFTLIILVQNNKGTRFGGWCRCGRLVSLKTLCEECSTISPACSPAGEMPLILFCRVSCRTVHYQKQGKKDLHSEFAQGSPESLWLRKAKTSWFLVWCCNIVMMLSSVSVETPMRRIQDYLCPSL